MYESIVPDKPPEPKEFYRRIIRITRDDVRQAGMTPGCEGCVAANRGIASRPHSEECRMRMEEHMSKRQDKRVERYEKRLAEEVEKQVEENKRNKIQQPVVDNPANVDQRMPDGSENDQNKKRNREPDSTKSYHQAAASSSGMQGDSSGKPLDTKMQEEETRRNNKRSSSDESSAQERETKVLVTAPEQGTKKTKG